MVDPHQIKELKRLIDQQLRSREIYGEIRSILGNFLEQNADSGINSEEHVLKVLQERGLLNKMIDSLHRKNKVVDSSVKISASANKAQQLLHLKIQTGKAFLEYVNEHERQTQKKLLIHLQYRDQRFTSGEIPACTEPDIDEDFMIELDKSGSSDPAHLLSIQEKIQIVVICLDKSSGKKSCIGSHQLDWRSVLKQGLIGMSVELGSSDLKVPRGILEMRLELLPRPKTKISETELQNQQNIERTRITQAEREFYMYSKQWYEEFKSIRPSHKDRIVKIYAESESGGMRPVTSYVYPLRAKRLIESPSEAARFVSLIEYEKSADDLSSSKEIWWSNHTFLSRQCGDIANHAILLCSLLLGFGMDAYVCIGTDEKAARLWVMTRNDDDIVFWESLTGRRYTVKKAKFQTIGCVFNHQSFYANIQRSDLVKEIQFDLQNERHWKVMSRMKLSVINQMHSNDFYLVNPTINPTEIEIDTEKQIRIEVEKYRQSLGFPIKWDDEMSYLLSPALVAYENERAYGVQTAQCLKDFHACIKNHVPEGHTFKAFPMPLNHYNPQQIMQSLLKSKICSDILQSNGDLVRYGLRVKIYAYPENILSVWIMLAVKYQQIQ